MVSKMFGVLSVLTLFSMSLFSVSAQSEGDNRIEYKLLATRRTSTMQKELNEAGAQGFRFEGIMGGTTALSGQESVCVLSRRPSENNSTVYEYKLLATNRTSTMQKELQEAGDLGFQYCGQTVFTSQFGGDEVVVILERGKGAPLSRYEYKLLATNRTGTMEKELQEATRNGYQFVGLSVGNTQFGGHELVIIMRRPAK